MSPSPVGAGLIEHKASSNWFLTACPRWTLSASSGLSMNDFKTCQSVSGRWPERELIAVRRSSKSASGLIIAWTADQSEAVGDWIRELILAGLAMTLVIFRASSGTSLGNEAMSGLTSLETG